MSIDAYDKTRASRSRRRSIGRGMAAAVALVVTGIDALVTARLGIPRLTWVARRLGREIADEYRRGYHNAVDTEVIDEERE